MPVDIGKLNHPIRLQSCTRTQDVHGQPLETWATYASVWANIKNKGGSESQQAGQTQANTVATATIRYRRTVTPEHRFLDEHDNIYNIRTIADPDGGNKYLALDCVRQLEGTTTETT